MKEEKRHLHKSSPAPLAGVCGGLAEFVGWSPHKVRYLWVAITLLSGVVPGVVAYTLLAIAMPGPDSEAESFDLERFRVQ